MICNCPRCGAELKPRVIYDVNDGELNFLICTDCPYCMGIPQPSLQEVYNQRARVKAAMESQDDTGTGNMGL